MPAPPVALGDPSWRGWIIAAPGVDPDDRGDAYHRAASRWLDRVPSGRPPPTGDRVRIRSWIQEYLADLQFAATMTKSQGSKDLEKASWAVLGGLATFGAGKSLIVIGMVSFSPIAAGLGGIAIGYAAASAYRNSFKDRRLRMLLEIVQRLRMIRDSL